MKKTMKLIAALVLPVAAMLLPACSTGTAAIAATEQLDSLRIEVRTETIHVTDTVYIEIPAQVEERTTRDSTSLLENDYATSLAMINTDGTLYHDLKTKARRQAVEVPKTVERTDSIVYRYVQVQQTVPVEVEKQLTAWQQFRLKYFLPVAAVLLCFILWTFRSPLLKILRSVSSLLSS